MRIDAYPVLIKDNIHSGTPARLKTLTMRVNEDMRMTRFSTILFAAAAASVLGACVYGPPPPYYGPGPYGAGVVYDDPCMTDEDYCDYAYYEGPIWFEGTWYSGPHRWRDAGGGHREFWVHGGWHSDVRVGGGGHWRGPSRRQHE